MPTPAPSASVESFFEFNEYCSAALGADPAAKDLEPLVAAASDTLGKAVAARTETQRKVNRTAAVRDFTFRLVMSAIETLERKTRAEFDQGQAAAGYKRLFPKSPAQLGKTSIESRASVFEGFLAEAGSRETPAVLERPVKAVSAAWTAYAAAVKQHVLAQGALVKAREKEGVARTDNITALRKLEGKLTDRFPDDTRRVRSYFPPVRPGQKKADAPPPPPVANVARDGR